MEITTTSPKNALTEEELAVLNYSGAPDVKITPPGPKATAIREIQQKYETRTVKYMKYFPTAWESGMGATLKDVDGNLFIDWTAGAGVINVGYTNPKVTEAIVSQARSSFTVLMSRRKAE